MARIAIQKRVCVCVCVPGCPRNDPDGWLSPICTCSIVPGKRQLTARTEKRGSDPDYETIIRPGDPSQPVAKVYD